MFHPEKPNNLNPEELKKKVKEFEEQKKGLLPEFGLPEEEKRELEVSNDLIFTHKLGEMIEKLEKEGIKDEVLIGNMLTEIEENIDEGKVPNKIDLMWWTLQGSSFLIRLPFFKELQNNPEFKKRIKKIEKGIQNRILVDNALTWIEENIDEGKIQDNTYAARWALLGFSRLIDVPFFKELQDNLEFRERIKKIEKEIQNKTLIDNALTRIEENIDKGKMQGNEHLAWWALSSFSSLISIRNYFLNKVEQKQKKEEFQRAVNPKEKKVPPRPETREF